MVTTSATTAPKSIARLPSKRPFRNRYDATSAASPFVPMEDGYDMLRDSLRRIIHRLDFRASMSVAKLMREELSEEQIISFVDEWTLACRSFPWLNGRTGWDNNDAMRKACPHFEKIMSEADKFRAMHAERLREFDLLDVSICFRNGTVEQFKKEKAFIEVDVSILGSVFSISVAHLAGRSHLPLLAGR